MSTRELCTNFAGTQLYNIYIEMDNVESRVSAPSLFRAFVELLTSTEIPFSLKPRVEWKLKWSRNCWSAVLTRGYLWYVARGFLWLSHGYESMRKTRQSLASIFDLQIKLHPSTFVFRILITVSTWPRIAANCTCWSVFRTTNFQIICLKMYFDLKSEWIPPTTRLRWLKLCDKAIYNIKSKNSKLPSSSLTQIDDRVQICL
jgi:hypothetical protein